MAASSSADALTFNFPTNNLRAIVRDGEPWFVASDICAALGVQNASQAVARLDEDERAMFNIGPAGECHIVNESGLYSLILGSRKPEAKRFKKWVTAEVLPAIRRTGRYEGAAPAGDGLVVAGLMGQVGLLQAQVTERDEVIALKDRAISGLQTSLLGALGKQVKLLERISGLQYRHSRREAVRLAVDMERRGVPREQIIQATGLNQNYLRQVLFRARNAGDLPPLVAAAAAATTQQQLDLVGVRHG